MINYIYYYYLFYFYYFSNLFKLTIGSRYYFFIYLDFLYMLFTKNTLWFHFIFHLIIIIIFIFCLIFLELLYLNLKFLHLYIIFIPLCLYSKVKNENITFGIFNSYLFKSLFLLKIPLISFFLKSNDFWIYFFLFYKRDLESIYSILYISIIIMLIKFKIQFIYLNFVKIIIIKNIIYTIKNF